MTTFLFKLYTRVSGLEIIIGQIKIAAKNYDDAKDIFDRKDLPFHSFSTVESVK